MLVYKDNIVDGILFSLHFQNFPPSDAYAMLCEMGGADDYTVEKVEEKFKEMDEKTFKLKVEREIRIELLPSIVQELITNKLDIQSRMSLRKTCHHFCNLVDKDRLSINKLRIYWDEPIIKISIDDLHATYTWTEDLEVARIKCGQKSKYLKGIDFPDFVNLACYDVMSIISNKKVTISTLSFIQKEKFEDKDCGFLISDLRKKMIRSQKLKVENLKICSQHVNKDVRDILPFLDRNCIKTIKLTELDDKYISRIREVTCRLRQWRRVKRLETAHVSMPFVILRRASHFNYFNGAIHCAGMSHEVFIRAISTLTRKLLKNPNLEQYKMKIHLTKKSRKELRRQLGVVLTPNSKFSWATRNYPESRKRLRICVTRKFIWIQGPAYVGT